MISVVTACTDGFEEGQRYVHALWEGLHRFLGKEFVFYCIRDGDDLFHEEIHPVKPVRGVWGWWNKMEIFRRDARWSDTDLLWLDLDTVVRGDVSWLAEGNEPVFLQPISDQYGIESPLNGRVADGVVFLPKGNHLCWIWDAFEREVNIVQTQQLKRLYMEHVWLTQCMNASNYRPALFQEKYPGKICSFKQPREKTREPEEPLVVFHGNPRPHEAMERATWIRKYFK